MQTEAILLLAIMGVCLLWVATLWGFAVRVKKLRQNIQRLDSAKRSQSTRYGQISEQFIPFADAWPWDSKRFKFLGDPIDGIQFTDEGVILVEIKSARSRLSTVQRQVRDHVQAGRVTWKEIRIE